MLLGEAAANLPREEFDEKFLACPVCQNIFDNPRVLPCLHTFCARCLDKWRKGKSQFTCPTCRQQVSLQGEDVTSLPPNFYINSLLDFRALQSREQVRIQCQMCESGARVAGSCKDCNFFLCKNCIGIHGKIPALKDHHISVHDTRREYCPKHTDQRLTFYCLPCTKLVCQDCTINEHRLGPDHNPQEVSKVALEYKANLITLLEQTQNTADSLTKTKETIDKELTSITTNYQTVKKEIGQHIAELKAKLETAMQELADRLDKMEKTQKEPLFEEMEVLEETSKSTADGMKFCRDVLVRGNDIEILSLGQQLENRLNILRATKISYKGLTEQISFQPNTEMLTGSPGSLSFCNASIVFSELPVESVPTTIVFRSQVGQVQGTPQITVTSSALGQCAMLDTNRTSDGIYEAVWKPQILGKHVVGVTTGEGGGTREGENTDDRVNICSPLTVDVGSNNPILRFGQEGSRQGQFSYPTDVEVWGDRLYVADLGNKRVQVFDLSGNFCSSFSTDADPRAVAVQTDGTIVVNTKMEVKKFSPSGKLLHKFTLYRYCTDPSDLAVQRDGRIVVADQGKHRIFLFESDGKLVKQVGGQGEGEGQFSQPAFVCVDNEDNIIVSDKENDCVQVFDKDLNFRHKFGQWGRQPEDMYGPMGVTADSRGNIVMANIGGKTDGVEHSKKIQVFRPDGTWVCTISSDGDEQNRPHGVAVTEDRYVFVADYKDHCIRKYRYM
ncbi:E3 ubiquitin-protein ligase TRIM71-like [Branchiostoma floridae x Branchiostoma japonicum]